jgi:gluconate 2-dehydrogenase gamma chain
VERRTALKVIAGSAVARPFEAAQHHLANVAGELAPYKLQFFSPAQNDLLNRLTDMIIPTDDHSPGARDARVSLFIDLMVFNSKPGVQDQWVAGLKAVEGEAQTRFQKPFLKCDAQQQDQIMTHMATNEASLISEMEIATRKPATELDHFFVKLKSMTIEGYYTSAIGIHKDLQYQGNAVLAEFTGCTHPEHQA